MPEGELHFNEHMELLLAEPEFAEEVLGGLTSFYRRLNASSLGEQLIADGVPVWTLMRNELLQALEPELYRLQLALAVIRRESPSRIRLSDEDPVLTRAVKQCADALGIPVAMTAARSSRKFSPRSDDELPRLPKPGVPPIVNPALGPSILMYAEWMGNVSILRPLLTRLANRSDVRTSFLRRSARHDTAGIEFDQTWRLSDVLAMEPHKADARTAADCTDQARRLCREACEDGAVPFAPLVRRQLSRLLSAENISAVTGRALALRTFLDQLRPSLVANADGIMQTPVTLDWAAASLDILTRRPERRNDAMLIAPRAGSLRAGLPQAVRRTRSAKRIKERTTTQDSRCLGPRRRFPAGTRRG